MLKKTRLGMTYFTVRGFAVLEEQVFKGVVTARVLRRLNGFFRLTGIPSQLRIVARCEDIDDLHLIERPRVHVGVEIELRNGAKEEGFGSFPTVRALRARRWRRS